VSVNDISQLCLDRIKLTAILFTAAIVIYAIALGGVQAQQTNFVELTPEQLALRMQDMRNRVLTLRNSIDIDKNGILSASEIERAAESLGALDQNHDGVLDPAESHGGKLPVPDKVRLDWVFNFIDDDGDLVISAEEIRISSAALRQLDTNNDWSLTTDELEKSAESVPVFFGQPPQFHRVAKWSQAMRSGIYPEIFGPILPGADKRAFDGYTFYFGSYDDGRTQVQKDTFLRDTDGRIVHRWKDDLKTPDGVSAYLLENGLLLRAATRYNWKQMEAFPLGTHGVVQLVDWDSKVLWSFDYCQLSRYCLHHDLAPLPNGNILAMVFDVLSYDDAVAMGWERQTTKNGVVYSERLIEIEPDLKTGGSRIVWQWDSRDHLIQDHDAGAWNYGDVAANPAKIDPNFARMSRMFVQGQLFHLNSIDYSPSLDQIIVSSATNGEIWIIDHSISSEQARTSRGDLRYRFGNPAAHRSGSPEDQILYWQHDAHWTGMPGEIQLFNNGAMRGADGKPNPDEVFLGLLDGAYSNVMRMKLPLIGERRYDFSKPPQLTWQYNSDGSEGLYAPFMSSARTLPNGNVIMVQSHNNRVLEVTASGEKVADYQLPEKGHLFRVYKLPKDYPAFKDKF
jgi:hypothetical protein